MGVSFSRTRPQPAPTCAVWPPLHAIPRGLWDSTAQVTPWSSSTVTHALHPPAPPHARSPLLLLLLQLHHPRPLQPLRPHLRAYWWVTSHGKASGSPAPGIMA